MQRIGVLTVAGLSFLIGVALHAGAADAQQKTLKEQLVGTWTVVAADTVRQDGSRSPNFGTNPKGMVMFDGNGRFAVLFMAGGRPKFASGNRSEGTPNENRTTVQGSLAYFGTYSVSEADKTFTFHVEDRTFPNFDGSNQKRIVTSLTADELKWTNPATSIGTTAEVVWKRVK